MEQRPYYGTRPLQVGIRCAEKLLSPFKIFVFSASTELLWLSQAIGERENESMRVHKRRGHIGRSKFTNYQGKLWPMQCTTPLLLEAFLAAPISATIALTALS